MTSWVASYVNSKGGYNEIKTCFISSGSDFNRTSDCDCNASRYVDICAGQLRRGWISEFSRTFRPPPAEHEIALPEEHELADWLGNNTDVTINVTAGKNSDFVGGVSFSCPPDGEDCAIRITRDGDSIKTTSTGGMATAIPEKRDPPPPEPTRTPISQPTTQQLTREALRIPDHHGNPRRSGSFHFTWLHGLHAAPLPVADETANPEILSDHESSVFSIDDGETENYGRVNFSCKGQGCEVKVHRRSFHHFNVTYTGNVTATLLPFNTEKMWENTWGTHDYCLNDSPGDCTLSTNATILNLFPRSTIRSKEIIYKARIPWILTEDRKTRITSNYGWQGKRYVNNSDGSVAARKNRLELIIYTNADGPEDTDYLSYGRSLNIKENGDWLFGGVYEKSAGSTYGLGDLTGKVTYRGGATGWYAFNPDEDDEADAGYFNARATLYADLNSDLSSNDNLLIKGTIDRFVDEDNRSRNWKVELDDNIFKDRSGARINIDTPKRAIWTIDGIPTDKRSGHDRWEGYAADNGNSIHGGFQAGYINEDETEVGRLSGAFGAERR